MLAARTKVVAIVACSSVVIIIVLAYIIVRNRFGSCYDSATGKVYNVDQKYLYLAHGDGVYAYPNHGDPIKVPPCASPH